jgi:hypothetical protein
MIIPEFHNIRVIHASKVGLNHVHVQWHGRARPKTNVGEIVLEPKAPDLERHHLAFGKFMDGWSKAEGQLRGKIVEILGKNKEARTVAYALSGRDLVQMLTSLAEPHLSSSNNKTFIKLLDRLGKVATKRNRMVHGYWTLVCVVKNVDGKPQATQEVFREYPPPSPTEHDELQVLGSKSRKQYTFSSSDIDDCHAHLKTVYDEITAFFNSSLKL